MYVSATESRACIDPWNGAKRAHHLNFASNTTMPQMLRISIQTNTCTSAAQLTAHLSRKAMSGSRTRLKDWIWSDRMQVTSAGAAEMIAVSTILSYDLYRGYIRREAQGPNLCSCLGPSSQHHHKACMHTLFLHHMQVDTGLVDDAVMGPGPEVLLISRVCVVLFGFAMGGLAILFDNVGISLNYVRPVHPPMLPLPLTIIQLQLVL